MSARHPARLIPVFLLVLIGVGLVQVGFLVDKTTISSITTPIKGIMKGSPYHQSSAEEAITSVHDPYKATDVESNYFYKWGKTRGGYRWVTESRLRALAACSARGDCPANAHKVGTQRTWGRRLTERRRLPSLRRFILTWPCSRATLAAREPGPRA